MLRPIRVGLIDSAVRGAPAAAVVETRLLTSAGNDRTGHGTQIASCVLQHCPSAELLVAQVFGEGRDSSVDAVLEGLDWLVSRGVQLINMSFGMGGASARLASACRRAASAGAILVASAPARGSVTFPAALGDCLAVTGDARCAPGEVSWLGTPAADFGTHPFCDPRNPERGGGASIAAARMTGLIGSLLEGGADAFDVRRELRCRAAYVGAERRHA
ncbi:subtilisin-like serine protease QhpE [Aromatoleum petrolei]|uniref:S8 family serine peptidase n=1 Tax=Aromatoleum petrolei TaxID=76116 RepID=A0ABX1MM16_9RHOO|nr:S8 family serine peptidase [Aromatoleum petrolei]NMF88997.1 S8 family serine peptidase [Aromatoleum petrolei]QTQ34357.1 Peptidase, S8/S53 family [Aromatoleum petrolei]